MESEISPGTKGSQAISPDVIYFISGDIFQHLTGGTLCDRMVAEELERTHQVRFVVPQIASLNYRRQLLAGFINNFRNAFRSFPRGALLFLDHGVYRDCFLAANLWKWLYRCRIIGLVYHLDYELPGMRGGRSVRATIEKLLVRTYDYALTISQSTAGHLQALALPSNRIAQIPVSRRFGVQDFVERASRPESVTLLFIGAVQPRKGLHDAIIAIGKYCGTARIAFRCVGNFDPADSYIAKLEAMAAGVPLLNLELLGAIAHESLVDELRRADGFLFPSQWEGYGIAIEEAMCFGLPVIAYEVGAVPELVEDGKTGWLVPLGDVDALGRAITACVNEPRERLLRGRNGLEKARDLTTARDLKTIVHHAISVSLQGYAD